MPFHAHNFAFVHFQSALFLTLSQFSIMTSTAGTKRKAQSPRTIPIAAYESLEQLAQMWKGKAREKDLLPLLKQGYVVVRKVIPLTDIAKWKKETEKVVSILDACAAAHAKEETKNKDRDPDETESDKE
jgi:uncharacterized protein YukE